VRIKATSIKAKRKGNAHLAVARLGYKREASSKAHERKGNAHLAVARLGYKREASIRHERCRSARVQKGKRRAVVTPI
jgi:hypothetical protein